jgi:transposase
LLKPAGRRRWVDDEKLKIVLQSMQTPPALSSTARQYGHLALAFAELATIVSARSRMALEQKSGFVPAMVAAIL